jgi:hypothetical protein
MATINNKVKLAVASLVCVLSYLSYDYYQKKNTQTLDNKNITDEDLKNSIINTAKNYGKGDQQYKGIYLYSKESNMVYLRSTDGKIYRAGKLSDCPFLQDPDNTVTAYQISDVYETFNCKNIPPELKNKYTENCSQKPDSDISVLMTSAKDFEKRLIDVAVGDITPSQDICFNNSQGTTSYDNGGLKPESTPDKFVESNKDKIIEFIEQMGLMIAAERISIFFCISIFVLPGVFGSSGWEKEKQELFGGEMLYVWLVKKLQEKTTESILKNGSEIAIREAEGQVLKVAEKIAIDVATQMEIVTLKLLLTFTDLINPLFEVVGYFQLIGMIIDVFDFCHLNNINTSLTQNILDSAGKGQTMFMNSLTNYNFLGTPFDPSRFSYCNYDLDPTTCQSKFENCKSQIFIKGQKWGDGQKIPYYKGKTEITKEEYCSDISNEYSKYVNEYLSNLKVNSLGQCIKTPTNQEWADILKYYIKDPTIDFNQLANVTKDNYPSDLYPKSETAKMFDIFLVNQNSYVAEFIKDNFYYFLSFFIVILLIIFLV